MVTAGRESARRVLVLAKEMGETVARIAREQSADPAIVSLAVMMAGYMLVRFSSKPHDIERRYWDAARIAKEMFDLLEPLPPQASGRRKVGRVYSTTNPAEVRALASAFRDRLKEEGEEGSDG